MLHTFHLEVAVLEAVDFGREKGGDKEQLAEVDWFSILSAEVVYKGTLGRIDPVGSLDFLRVEFAKSIRCLLEVVLQHHLVVYFVLRLHQLAFCLLHLQVEQVHILRLGKVPVQVVVDQFD